MVRQQAFSAVHSTSSETSDAASWTCRHSTNQHSFKTSTFLPGDYGNCPSEVILSAPTPVRHLSLQGSKRQKGFSVDERGNKNIKAEHLRNKSKRLPSSLLIDNRCFRLSQVGGFSRKQMVRHCSQGLNPLS